MDWNLNAHAPTPTPDSAERRRRSGTGNRYLVAREAPCGHMLFLGAEGHTFSHELAKDFLTVEEAYRNRPTDLYEVVAIFTIWPRDDLPPPKLQSGEPDRAALKRSRHRNYAKRNRRDW